MRDDTISPVRYDYHDSRRLRSVISTVSRRLKGETESELGRDCWEVFTKRLPSSLSQFTKASFFARRETATKILLSLSLFSVARYDVYYAYQTNESNYPKCHRNSTISDEIFATVTCDQTNSNFDHPYTTKLNLSLLSIIIKVLSQISLKFTNDFQRNIRNTITYDQTNSNFDHRYTTKLNLSLLLIIIEVLPQISQKFNNFRRNIRNTVTCDQTNSNLDHPYTTKLNSSFLSIIIEVLSQISLKFINDFQRNIRNTVTYDQTNSNFDHRYTTKLNLSFLSITIEVSTISNIINNSHTIKPT